MLWDARKHRSPKKEHCVSTQTASSTYIRVQNGLAAPVPWRYANGIFTYRRLADRNVAGDRLAKRGDASVMSSRVDMCMFKDGRTQTAEPLAIPPANLKAPIDYDQIMKGVREQGLVRLLDGNLPRGVLRFHFDQQDERGGDRRATGA